MRISLEMVVIAIIIMIVAVVTITIFGGGIGQFGMATDARASCLNQGKWTCETSGTMPAGWDSVYVIKDTSQTCASLVRCTSSACCDKVNKKWKGQ
ncbi:MAG: hypothetical protein V3U72_01120 [Candidatus Aenigmarchaeota archaeon]